MASPKGQRDTLTIQAVEFQRLQSQLIELRTANYQLKEEQQKLASEFDQLNDELQTKGRELDKANKALHRSKKAKEMSSLLEENGSLQQKLQSQEEDFNLQNRTLMEEISRVCEESEGLKTRLKKTGGGGEGEGLTRLRAENTALQKSLQMLRGKLSDAGKQETAVEQVDGEGSGSEVAQPAVLELQLQLDTEKEEKALLLKKLEEVQESARKDQAQLQSQLDTWVEKAKKKQDSFVKLQEEKEKLFVESRAAFDAMVRSKEREIQSLQDQVQKLSKDLQTKDEMSSVGAEIAQQLQSLSTGKEELNLKCNSLIHEREGVVRERDELKSLAEELGRELHQSKAQVGELRTETEYLNTQLEEARHSQEQLADQVAKASEDRQTLEKKLESAEKLAEKRKTLVDEMSIRGQETAEEQKKKMEVVQEKLRKEVESLERLLDEERSEVRRLSTANDEIPELQKRVRSLEEEKESHTATVSNLEATIKEQRASHEREIQRRREEDEAEKESLGSLLSGVRREVEEERARARELEMAVQDKEEMVRIVEKKSNALLKDLKRQLAHMQKREEKRQEQLSELTTGGEGYGAGHEQSTDNLSKHSRESSLSSIRGHLPADGSITSPSSTHGTGGSSSFPLNVGGVSEEMRDLLARVTELQREKWELEERVNHLETTGSALAEDVVNKSEIIKSYYMHNKADHTPPRRTVADKMSPMRLLGASSKEDTLNEINRKMQRALEETLTKNIHLQENVLMLTAELQKYTDKEKLLESSPNADDASPPPPTSGPSSDSSQDPSSSSSQSSSDHMTVT